MIKKGRNMWGIVGMFCVIIGAFALFMEKRQSSSTQNKNHEKTQGLVLDSENKSEKRHQELLKELGLNEKSEVLLKQLLGNNFKDVLNDEEAFNSLKSRLKEKSLEQILDDNKALSERINKLEFINNTNFKKQTQRLLSELKYESARIEIELYIKDNPELNPKFIAQLYALKAQTYSEKDKRDYRKIEEFILKAYEMDDRNPEIVLLYGEFLNHTNEYNKSIEVLEKLIEYKKNGLSVSHIEMTSVYYNLANSSIQIEGLKPLVFRSYNVANEYLELSKTFDTNLTSENSKYSQITRLLAEIEMNKRFYENAIELYNKSLAFGFKYGLNKPFDTADNAAMCFLALGTCYKMVYLQKGKQEMYNRSKDSYNIALKTFEELYGNKATNVGACYTSLGSLIVIKDNDKAIEYFLKAMEIYESNEVHRTMALAGVYNNLALSYNKVPNDKEAKLYAMKALKEYRKILPEFHEKITELKFRISL